jgi:hypothetical protein
VPNVSRRQRIPLNSYRGQRALYSEVVRHPSTSDDSSSITSFVPSRRGDSSSNSIEEDNIDGRTSEFVRDLLGPREEEASFPLREEAGVYWSPDSPSHIGTETFEPAYETEDETATSQADNPTFTWDPTYSPPLSNSDRSRYILPVQNARYPLSRLRGYSWETNAGFGAVSENDETINELFEDAVRRPI